MKFYTIKIYEHEKATDPGKLVASESVSAVSLAMAAEKVADKLFYEARKESLR